MGEPYFKWVALYLWGEVIDFGRTRHPLSLVMKCKGALLLGVPNANALRGKYPIMRHAHEKVHWRYVDGMGVQSVDPPCTGAARIGDSGEQLPCVPCAAVPSHPTMCVWMRKERNADSSTPHFKLGFLNLTKRANGYRADKRNAVQVLQRVSDVCQTLVQKCDAHKALILAIGADNRPLASRWAVVVRDNSNTSGSSSNSSSSSGSNSSQKAAKKKGLAKKGKKRATSSSSSNSSSGSDKKPAKKKPAGKQGKKRAATSQGGKAKKR